MVRLVLINGAPGSGKSTLARMYMEAGLIARRLALEMARVQLSVGRDVLVPQFLGRLDFVLELEQLCRQVGAGFVRLVLLSGPQDAVDRFVRRSRHPETSVQRNAQALLEHNGGVGELPAMYEDCSKWSRAGRRPSH